MAKRGVSRCPRHHRRFVLALRSLNVLCGGRLLGDDIGAGCDGLRSSPLPFGGRGRRQRRVGDACLRGGTRHILVDTAAAAKAALRVNVVGPAAQQPHLTSRIPEVRLRRLAASGEGAPVRRRRNVVGTRNALEGSLCAEAALPMDAIGQAAQLAKGALGVPIVRHLRLVRERALRRALGNPSTGIVVPCASANHLWALDARVGTVPTEAALGMYSICPTAEHAHLASGVPKVRHEGLVREVAAGRRARDIGEVPCSAEAALHILAVGIASKHTHLARGIPQESRERRLVDELAYLMAIARKVARGARCRGC
mmetsp:Transcript_141652/g.452983  ORF Transcript_141652/g.452983 Transcript_141652/m.452983 type:complete len:312 (+) Transcript_141652:196-1131(+)